MSCNDPFSVVFRTLINAYPVYQENEGTAGCTSRSRPLFLNINATESFIIQNLVQNDPLLRDRQHTQGGTRFVPCPSGG